MSTDKDLTDVKAWAFYYAPEPLKTKLANVLARLEAAAAEQPWRVAAVDEQEKRMAAEAMARAEQERADVMQRERDWEQEVVNADLWNRLQAAEAQRDALAEALRWVEKQPESSIPGAYEILQAIRRRARAALAELEGA